MISYNWKSQELAWSLTSCLSHLGIHVWLDVYRMENAHSLQDMIYAVPKQVLFVIAIVNPNYLSSVNCCIELLSTLDMDPARSVFFVDGSMDWNAGASPQDAERILREHGRHVVTSVEELLQHIDAR
ncbi:hypothetical protein GUITHDRAFT_102801 [Guillardia theta CCMP2712]|uniref:TIR domain-containing protein n=1 Tax=Guillardia theta (strain CCMP2712) TaxID=905079 RepID=L1JTX7_GUITC|nr:hypothetical protein GUITHDRAFT_102801 [Guillardia theta CCMP2712]EKX51538.1 hypothetical protein GUITHDRAFT_102801 [Guillardia theta CCMP2712]|eukprot:XP_005838518.1 hypothetical protein GUITHDRAFT_102801 [Guillardia theta CCMP2712]